MKKIIIFILLSFLLSCKTQEKIIKKETNYIINLVLSQFKESICLDEETFFEHSRRKSPYFLIDYYLGIYNYSIMNSNDSIKNKNIAYEVFYKDIDGIIKKEELKKIKNKNLKWQKPKWKASEIVDRKTLLITSLEDIKSKCTDRIYLKVSEPVFTEDMNKAMVFVVKSKHKSGSSSYIEILKKEKGVWKIKGGIPIGIGG